LHPEEDKVVEFKNGVFKAIPADSKTLPLVKGLEGSLVDTSIMSFEPTYKIHPTKDKFTIYLEVPSIPVNSIKCKTVDSTEANTFAVKIFGKKKPLKLGKQELVQTGIKDVTKKIDYFRYGAWSLKFHIPLAYVVSAPKGQEVPGSPGIVEFVFPVKTKDDEDNEDNEDDKGDESDQDE